MSFTILGLSGSLRRQSRNTALLRAAQEMAPEDVEVVIRDLRPIPFYDGDVEAEIGFPPAVAELRQAVAGADALLLASPEYNWSVTAVLKNAIDWLSRAPDSPLDGHRAAMVSAAGGSGGARSQAHLRDAVAHNGVHLLEDSLMVARSRDHFVDGRLDTAEHRNTLASLLIQLSTG